MICLRQYNLICFYMLMTCLVYSDKNVLNIEKQLNNDFNSLCDWFEDNKLSIHFGQEKTKSILFSKRKEKMNPLLSNEETP